MDVPYWHHMDLIHKVAVDQLKVRWTTQNRDQVFRMIDLYRQAKSLRSNLSTDALKSIELHSSNGVTTKGWLAVGMQCISS